MNQMSKIHKTTKADFEYFKRHCRWWFDYFGINEFEFVYDHKKLNNALATTSINYEDKILFIGFGSEFTDSDYQRMSRKEMARMALHEVSEAMLFELRTMSCYVFSDSHVSEKVHEIIHRLENTLFEEKWESTLKRLK